MKRLFSLMVAALFSGTMMAQAVIKFEKNRHDFGAFNKTEPQTCTFEFTNTGTEPLVIHQAFGSCGCTVPKPPKEPVAPGEKAVIRVTFDGKSQFTGRFTKSITIRSNATNAVTRVYITGVLKDENK